MNDRYVTLQQAAAFGGYLRAELLLSVGVFCVLFPCG